MKIAEELVLRDWKDRGRVGTVVLRPGIVFGPGDRHATPLFLEALAARPRFYVGTGNNRVSSLAVEDLALAVGEAVARPGIEGRCYPLAAMEPTTQRDLFELHARFAGLTAPRHRVPRPLALGVAAWAEHLLPSAPVTRLGAWIVGTSSPADCAAARADLGFTGASSVAHAIRRSVEWLRGVGMTVADTRRAS